jgi:UDP-N-acetylmuramoylalanine--D-glutamate ligase
MSIHNKLQEFFTGKSVLILGYGREGRSTHELLRRLNIDCDITVADKNIVDCDAEKTIFGADYDKHLGEYDIVVKSPGVPLLGEIAPEIKARITCQTDLLFRFRDEDTPIIGVTGTKGKSTTATLIHHILTACGRDALLIGNIGIPPLARLDDFKQGTILVCECSCHQLEYTHASPQVAVYLNLYEEHLDHYNSFADYQAAKENICRFQREADLLIKNKDLDPFTRAQVLTATMGVAKNQTADIFVTSKMIGIEGRAIPLAKVKTRLPGRHNLYNIAAAMAVALRFGCDLRAIVDAVAAFGGLPHRLERIEGKNGVFWVNDSISTIPHAAVNALLAFPEADTLIVGGMDRGIDYTALIDFLPKSHIQRLICLPDSGLRIAKALSERNANLPFDVIPAADLPDGVKKAAAATKRGCVFSPAAASYGFYRDFEERGDVFKVLVDSL